MKKKRLPALAGILLIILLAVVLLGKPFAEKSEGESSILSGESSGAAEDSANSSANESAENSAESSAEESQEPGGDESAGLTVEKGQPYSSKDEVALYLHEYGELPPNYLTKKEAQALGWDSSKGNLWEVAPQMSIGGDVFGNREGLLPKKNGRTWYECDVNYQGGFRGAERILYSSDGLIYYTDDHYESFTRLY